MLERVQFDSPGRELAPGLSLSRIRDFEAVRVSGYTSTRPPPATGMGGGICIIWQVVRIIVIMLKKASIYCTHVGPRYDM